LAVAGALVGSTWPGAGAISTSAASISLSLPFDFTHRSCGQHQVWDGLRRACYNISCGFLYDNVAGECIYRNITQDLLRNAVDKDCYMITLHPWELRRVNERRASKLPDAFVSFAAAKPR
jgi:hypothetical protein